MLRWIVVLCAFTAVAMHGQEVRRPVRMLEMRPPSIDRYEALVRGLAAAIKRDAFIVAQLTHAAADLEDFQKLAAVEKANDRIEEALKRATQDPPASRGTLDTLNGLQQTLKHAREQGTMADTKSLQTEVLRRTHFIQRDLYTALDTARFEHRTIVEMETKLHQIGSELQSSMVEAMGTTFDFIRAGGR
jgi:hypothetical protein